MKKIKIFPILVAMLTASSGIKIAIDIKNSCRIVLKAKTYTESQTTLPSTTTPNSTTIKTSTTTNTYTTTVLQTTTSVTTDIKYKELVFLYDLTNDYSLDELYYIVTKYSSYSRFTYDEAINILKENINDIKNNYVNIEAGIIDILFTKSNEYGLLSDYCDENMIETRDMTRDEQENIMIDMCNSMEISNNEKAIILAIFRFETGNGDSYLCTNCNNYGGITVGNDFGKFQTPEYGMYKAIKCMYGHIINSKNRLYTDDTSSIIYDMAPTYCPPDCYTWAENILSMTYEVNNTYNNFENEKKYEK